VLPLAMVVSNLVNFLLSGAVLLVYLAVVRAAFGAVLWVPAVILTQFALCLGVALLVSCANVFFRDTEHIVSVTMLAWFFLTPVIYPVTLVTERFPSWVLVAYFANPMTGIVTAYRRLLLSEEAPGQHLVFLSFAVAWGILLLGFQVFQRFQSRFGDEL